MILTDAGPLVALIDQGEQYHGACVDCLAEVAGPMLTTWPAFAESMYLLGEGRGGWRAQDTLWQFVENGDLDIASQGPDERVRMRVLMEKYRDLPMDLADASLVVLAEEKGLRDIFTLDQTDFRVYRINSRQTFRLWPKTL